MKAALDRLSAAESYADRKGGNAESRFPTYAGEGGLGDRDGIFRENIEEGVVTCVLGVTGVSP